jgi:amino acid transporter
MATTAKYEPTTLGALGVIVLFSALWFGGPTFIVEGLQRATIDTAVGIVAIVFLVYLAMAGWIALSFNLKNHQAYMDIQRRAVLELVFQPASKQWRVKNHVVAKVGEGYGAPLREMLVPAAQSIAGPAG